MEPWDEWLEVQGCLLPVHKPYTNAGASNADLCRCQNCLLVLQEHVKSGKVKALGLSEIAPADVERAVKVHPIACVEVSRQTGCLSG